MEQEVVVVVNPSGDGWTTVTSRRASTKNNKTEPRSTTAIVTESPKKTKPHRRSSKDTRNTADSGRGTSAGLVATVPSSRQAPWAPRPVLSDVKAFPPLEIVAVPSPIRLHDVTTPTKSPLLAPESVTTQEPIPDDTADDLPDDQSFATAQAPPPAGTVADVVRESCPSPPVAKVSHLTYQGYEHLS